jgi:hypothetical protein
MSRALAMTRRGRVIAARATWFLQDQDPVLTLVMDITLL